MRAYLPPVHHYQLIKLKTGFSSPTVQICHKGPQFLFAVSASSGPDGQEHRCHLSLEVPSCQHCAVPPGRVLLARATGHIAARASQLCGVPEHEGWADAQGTVTRKEKRAMSDVHHLPERWCHCWCHSRGWARHWAHGTLGAGAPEASGDGEGAWPCAVCVMCGWPREG